jgi:hypothetical protein
MGKPRYIKTLVPISGGNIAVYAGVRVANALSEVTGRMDLFQGVKLTQLLEAVYLQGKKDGARAVREAFEIVMLGIPHVNPGQPRRKRR